MEFMQLCDRCFLKNAGVKSHRSEPHCSWHRGLFFPFPSPNRALLCCLLTATQLQLPRMSRGQEGYSYCQQCFLCSQKGQNSNVKSLVCWLNLQCIGEKPCICTTGLTKGQRTYFWMSGVGQLLQLPESISISQSWLERRISALMSNKNHRSVFSVALSFRCPLYPRTRWH